jgi:glucose-1-phosphate adenylyltransferase
VVGDGAVLGTGGNAPNIYDKNVYAFGLVTVGENSVIPSGVRIGRNTAILGETKPEDYPDGELPGGGAIIKRKEGEAS